MIHARYLRPLLVVLSLAAIAGCTRGTADVHEWVAHEKAKKGAPLPPLPVIKTFETFVYTDEGKRDPFAPALSDALQPIHAKGPHPDQNRPRQPLEAFALDSLKMVGSIGSGTHIVALIQDPNKKIHRVHANQYMGQNYGRVTDISDSRVDLVELVSDGAGGWTKRQASIALSAQ
jgi:type IV pilus assembly protein PilP